MTFPVFHINDKNEINQIDSLQDLKDLYDDISRSNTPWPAHMNESDIINYIMNENNFDDHHFCTNLYDAVETVDQLRQL